MSAQTDESKSHKSKLSIFGHKSKKKKYEHTYHIKLCAQINGKDKILDEEQTLRSYDINRFTSSLTFINCTIYIELLNGSKECMQLAGHKAKLQDVMDWLETKKPLDPKYDYEIVFHDHKDQKLELPDSIYGGSTIVQVKFAKMKKNSKQAKSFHEKSL